MANRAGALGGPTAQPTEKLAQLLADLEHYVPTVPDELTQHYLKSTGYDCKDVRLIRLVSLAAQQFLASITYDAFQIYSRRQKQPIARLKEAGYNVKDKGAILTTEDLAEALQEYGVNLERPAFFSNSLGSAKK